MADHSVLAPLEHAPPVTVGRYVLHRQIARGGMATIHIARLLGDEGFSRIVAAKRLLPEFAEDAEFVAMFLDEARIASRLHHRNVVPVLDVVAGPDEVVLVQEYVHGAPLHLLLGRARQARHRIPPSIAVAIACQVLAGLHAAHEMTDELGHRLDVVHRDVSPQNVMIAVDGSARLLDFGIAKATMAAHVTREGTYKGKLAYSAPEQLRGRATRQSDLYSLSVLLWEILVGQRMHGGQSEAELVSSVMQGQLPSMSETLGAEYEWSAITEDHWQEIQALEPIVRIGLATEPARRWATAEQMEDALAAAVRPASPTTVAAWLKHHGKDYLEKHDRVLAAEEASWRRATQAGRVALAGRTDVDALTGSRVLALVHAPLEVAASLRATSPPAPWDAAARRTPQVVIALLSALVVALVVGIVLMFRGSTPPSSAAGLPHPAPPALAPPALAPPAPRVVGRPAAEPVPILEPPAAEPSPQELSLRTTVEAKPAPRRPAVRVVPRAPARKVAPTPPPAPEPRTEPRPDARSAGCTPPYYFEGTKKIFKPACL